MTGNNSTVEPASIRWRFGPGFLVTAAFIGPGTVRTASLAGAEFGYSLAWAIVFSVLATVAFQEMASRLAIVGRVGLVDAIRQTLHYRILQILALALVIVAIFVGNAAYQAGNIVGASSGLKVLSGVSNSIWIGSISAIVLALFWSGRFKLIQNVLTVLVLVMSALFVLAAAMSKINWSEFAAGMVPGKQSDGGWITAIALLGTTVVPYNLFLHANASLDRWADIRGEDQKKRAVRFSLYDTVLSVVVGGLITVAIMVTGGAFGGMDEVPKNIDSIAEQLKPALGNAAQFFFGMGLFAAGLTSAITAPLAAAYVFAGCFRFSTNLEDWRMKLAATVVLGTGAYFALRYATSPSELILTAQIANGLLLPLIVVFLIIVMNNGKILGNFRNRWFANVMGGIVLIVIALMTMKTASSLWEKFNPPAEKATAQLSFPFDASVDSSSNC
ncbi:MAG: Nramp family divalent metal transporter [Pirellulaceae bacterium]